MATSWSIHPIAGGNVLTAKGVATLVWARRTSLSRSSIKWRRTGCGSGSELTAGQDGPRWAKEVSRCECGSWCVVFHDGCMVCRLWLNIRLVGAAQHEHSVQVGEMCEGAAQFLGFVGPHDNSSATAVLKTSNALQGASTCPAFSSGHDAQDVPDPCIDISRFTPCYIARGGSYDKLSDWLRGETREGTHPAYPAGCSTVRCSMHIGAPRTYDHSRAQPIPPSRP